MTKDNLQGMLYSLELIKHGANSNSKNGKIARGKYELKDWQFYTLKVLMICANSIIWLFILYGITKLFI
jgi:hypothetical protein